jgi:hypothetical protein
VYENARVTSSVLGRKCTVAAGATVSGAYVFDDTTIGAGASVERSIVGARVSIGERAIVPPGCLIGDGVVIGPGARLRPFERVVRKVIEKTEEDEEDEESDEEDGEVVGEGSTLFECTATSLCSTIPDFLKMRRLFWAKSLMQSSSAAAQLQMRIPRTLSPLRTKSSCE